jgi:hypothetical protein
MLCKGNTCCPLSPLTLVVMQARKLAYYLNWMEIKTAIFNHGDYRRKRLGGRQPAEFFRPDNEEGMKLRYDMAKEALVRRVDSHTESHVEETCSTYLLLCAHNRVIIVAFAHSRCGHSCSIGLWDTRVNSDRRTCSNFWRVVGE